MLNPEFWLDEEIATISPMARLLYMGLWGICDDNYATFPNRPEWIKVQIFPYDQVDIKKLLIELEKIGKITSFKHENQEYWHIKNFFKHQRVDRPSKSKHPEYVKTLDEGSTRARTEVKRSKEKRKNIAPTGADLPKKAKNSSFDDPTPMTLQEFSESMKKSPQRHIQIIGEYATSKKIALKTKGQWREFTDRNVRTARRLASYTDEQIGEAHEKLQKDIVKEDGRTGKKVGFITKWSMETILKYVE